MKEMLFTKDESKFIRECLENEIISLKSGLCCQDMDTTNRNAKREKECQRLIKKFERAEKTITVSSRKGKGRGLQYWVCDKIAEMFGIQFIQSDDNCLIQSRPMGQHSVDIILRGELRKKFPFSIECKAQENLNIAEWIRQARENEIPETYWMLIFKKQTLGSKPIVCLDFETFLEFYRK